MKHLFATCLVLLAANACTAAKHAVADETYAADMKLCDDEYDSRAQIDACRQSVRIRWGVTKPTATLLDGGPANMDASALDAGGGQ